MAMRTRQKRLLVFFFKKKLFSKKKCAATNEIRTRDLSLTKRVLYQLSYSGEVISSFLQSGKTNFFLQRQHQILKRMNYRLVVTCLRHLGRVVKAADSKSAGHCPREFKPHRCRPLWLSW